MKHFMIILFHIAVVALYGQDIASKFYSLSHEYQFIAALELVSKSDIDETGNDILMSAACYLYEGRKNIAINRSKAMEFLLLLDKRLNHKQDPRSLFYKGLITKYSSQNSQLAYDYMKMAADAGYSDAQAEVAIMLIKGTGVKADPALAMTYLEKAAAQNNLTAKAYLALYHLGRQKNIAQGIRLARESSDAGNRAGQYTLGMAYEKGIGVENNDRKALRLYQPAADQGLDDARHRLSGSKANSIFRKNNILPMTMKI